MLMANVFTTSLATPSMTTFFLRLSSSLIPLRPIGIVILGWLFALTLQFAPALATGIYDLPTVRAGSPPWVIDAAEVLSRSSEGQISKQTQDLATQTGKEIRLVVIRRLDYGETIDNFADQLFSTWYPTPEEQTNQVLLVMDTLTNSVALRRGETVSEDLTDAIASSIVTQTVAYPLRTGSKYNQAALDASDRLIAILAGQPDPGPPQIQDINIDSTYASAEETDDRSATVWVIVLLALATIIPMVTYFWYVGLPGR
jgi:uncharacterized protein